jgi:hypothetical protein
MYPDEWNKLSLLQKVVQEKSICIDFVYDLPCKPLSQKIGVGNYLVRTLRNHCADAQNLTLR